MRKVFMLFLLLSLPGCGSTNFSQFSTEPLGSLPRKVAVFPLANLTTQPYAGQIVGELVFTELKKIPHMSIVDNPDAWKAFQGKETDLEEAALRQNVRQVGQQLGADVVFFGAVTEYRYKRGVDEEPTVGISLRLMEVATGRVVWGASLSKASGCCSFGGDSLSGLAQTVCQDLVKSMLKASPQATAKSQALQGTP